MKAVLGFHRLAVLLLILLAVVFLYGSVLAFSDLPVAHAGELAPTATLVVVLSGTLTATPSSPSADTTGILILGILLVVIILIGLLWGGRRMKR